MQPAQKLGGETVKHCFVWDTAYQSTKQLFVLKLGENGPIGHPWLRL